MVKLPCGYIAVFFIENVEVRVGILEMSGLHISCITFGRSRHAFE